MVDAGYDHNLSREVRPALALVRRFVFGEMTLDDFSRAYVDEVRIDEKDYPAHARDLLERILPVVRDHLAGRTTDAHEAGRAIVPVFWALHREFEVLKQLDEDFAKVRQGTSADIEPLLELMCTFIGREIDAPTFDHRYWDFHRANDYWDPPGMYPTLQEIFYAAEDYVEYEHLREPGDLDDDGLRARIAELEPELRRLYDEARARENPSP